MGGAPRSRPSRDGSNPGCPAGPPRARDGWPTWAPPERCPRTGGGGRRRPQPGRVSMGSCPGRPPLKVGSRGHQTARGAPSTTGCWSAGSRPGMDAETRCAALAVPMHRRAMTPGAISQARRPELGPRRSVEGDDVGLVPAPRCGGRLGALDALVRRGPCEDSRRSPAPRGEHGWQPPGKGRRRPGTRDRRRPG